MNTLTFALAKNVNSGSTHDRCAHVVSASTHRVSSHVMSASTHDMITKKKLLHIDK